MIEHPRLKAKGATWWHSKDYHSPNLSKASLGKFMYSALKNGAQIGDVWAFDPNFNRCAVLFTIFATEEMKNKIEEETGYLFTPPPTISLN